MQIFLAASTVLLSLVAIIYLFSKKFSQVSLLDVDAIPEVQEEKRKDAYLRKRLENRATKSKKATQEKMVPLMERLKNIQSTFRSYVGSIEREVFLGEKREQKDPVNDLEGEKKDKKSAEAILADAHSAEKKEKWEVAEKKYLGMLAVDPRNKEAYRGLADLYLIQEQYEEAAQTYSFLLQLDPKDDNVCAKLGEVEEGRGNIKEAIDYYQQAVIINPQIASRFAKLGMLLASIHEYETAIEALEQAVSIEDKNEAYLDNLGELAIIVGDQKRAKEMIEQLRMVNPDSPKIGVLKSKLQASQQSS